jgi:hypothetical protein
VYSEGYGFLEKEFPRLDYLASCKISSEEENGGGEL